MKRLILPLAIAPVLLLIMAFNPTSTAVMFAAEDWETSKSSAKTQGKLYFVDFDASYCATCRNMDETTYMSEELADYMAQHVVALRVDVQDFDGVAWSQKYEVEALPTMLIFNESGELVKRLVGYKSAGDLIQEFDQAKVNMPVQPKVSPAPIQPDEPMPAPGPVVDPSTLANNNTPTTTTTTTTTNTNAAPRPTGKGLYEIAVRKQESKGYGVQVGVFSSYESLLEAATKFKRKYSRKTLIHINEHQGNTVYKLMLGTFNTKREAAYFRNDLRRDNTVGLIKDLKIMQ